MLVDSDPQCNLTSYLIQDDVLDDLLDGSDSNRGETLWSALKPVFEAEGEVKIIPIKPTTIDNLFILPGDVRLSEFESELNDYWSACFQRKVKGFNGTTSISNLLDQLNNQHDFDFIIYDTGPNIGALNRSILLDCDFYIIPAACDLFSIRALKTLSRTLSKWILDWETILKIAPDGVRKLSGKPKFLGYVPQKFRIYGGKMVEKQQEYLDKFEEKLQSDFLNQLKMLDRGLIVKSIRKYQIGEVKDFSNLLGSALEQGVPLWQVDGGDNYQKSLALDSFTKIANQVINRSDKV